MDPVEIVEEDEDSEDITPDVVAAQIDFHGPELPPRPVSASNS
jgi:hypothetical protein